MVICIGSLATISRKPRQARKGATVVVDSGAEVMLVWVASTYFLIILHSYLLQHCVRKRSLTHVSSLFLPCSEAKRTQYEDKMYI